MTRKMVYALLCLAIPLSGCQAGPAGRADGAAFRLAELRQDQFSETVRQAGGFTVVQENERFSLSVNGSTCEAAVLDKKERKTWYSNPPGRDADASAQGDGIEMAASQLIVSYKNAAGELSRYYTSRDCVGLGQYAFEKIDGGVRVTYDLGEKPKVYLYPPRISRERMEQFAAKLGDEDREALFFLYYLIRLDDLAEADKKTYLADSPKLADTPEFYNVEGLFHGSRGITKVPAFTAEEAQELFKKAGYTQADMERDYAETGLKLPETKNAAIRVSVEYTIDEAGFKVRVPRDSISLDKTKFFLSEIDVLPYFGAAYTDQNGYIFVPDGSGALIHLNNGKTRYEPYKKLLYGADQAINHTLRKTSDGAQCYLPVFGLKAGDASFAGIIEEGDASCSITADISGRYNGYNHVSPVFLMTPDALIKVKGKPEIPDFQEDVIASDLCVRYLFLYGGASEYSGMAGAVRERFIETGKMTPAAQPAAPPLTLSLIGSAKYERNVMGFQFNSVKALTTYGQAGEIIKSFLDAGVGGLDVIYRGWGNQSVDNRLADRAELLRELGGRAAFDQLKALAAESGVRLIPDAEFMYVSPKSASGFSESQYAARNIQGDVADVIPYEYGTMRRREDAKGAYIVKPAAYLSLAERFLKSYARLGVRSLYLGHAGTDLNSDFHRGHLTDRTAAAKYAAQLSAKVGDAYGLTVSGGNLYALQKAEKLTDVPLESGKAYIIDRDVPFFSMVFRGTLPLSAKAPGGRDSGWYILKLIEAGVAPDFEMIYADSSELKETESNLICASFGKSRDEALRVSREVEKALGSFGGLKIRSHTQPAAGVSLTVYEDGRAVAVNFNEAEAVVEGKKVDGKSWAVLEPKGGAGN